jgi:signal transduction histidine kinase
MTTATRESIGRQARTPRLLAPLVRGETYRAVLFYIVGLGLGVAGFTLLVAGWAVTLALAITPLVVPLLIGLLFGVALLARVEAALVTNLLGLQVRPARAATRGGFWQRGFGVLKERAFWKQQAHLLLAWPVALIPLALLSWSLQLASLPIWYRWADSSDVFGFADIDRFVETLPFAAVGLAGVVLVAHLLGPWTRLSRWLATRLLAGDGVDVIRSPAEARARRLRALTLASQISSAIVIALLVIWALTGQGYFWPVWPLISLVLVVAIPGWIVLVLEHPVPARLAGGSRPLAIQVGVSALIAAFLVAVWANTTGGYFWPVWPALGLAVLSAISAAVVFAGHQHRIEALETSRAGAVDVQEAELRRIERDLHDGAQARLVALGMSLGLAEQHVDTDPKAVRELIAEARLGAAEALAELRDLARGIHPPILTDRGLEAAMRALIVRSPIQVSLAVDVPERPPAAVETAAYFTVSEALANAIKHADARRVDIRIETVDGRLRADVTDDGRGGADPAGRGLTGIRRRLEALDGTLRVSSPPGGPTTVHAELPCES